MTTGYTKHRYKLLAFALPLLTSFSVPCCSEKDAAFVIRTIVKVVGHCHSLSVMHR